MKSLSPWLLGHLLSGFSSWPSAPSTSSAQPCNVAVGQGSPPTGLCAACMAHSSHGSTDDPVSHVCLQQTLGTSSVPGAGLASRTQLVSERSGPPGAYFIPGGGATKGNKYTDMITSGGNNKSYEESERQRLGGPSEEVTQSRGGVRRGCRHALQEGPHGGGSDEDKAQRQDPNDVCRVALGPGWLSRVGSWSGGQRPVSVFRDCGRSCLYATVNPGGFVDIRWVVSRFLKGFLWLPC